VGREGGALSPALSGRIGAKRGGGQPLEATVRRGLEGVFQISFDHVRIHADPEADALNRGVAAIAFTVGSDIFFRAGFYQPHTPAGQHLLAHELTHVVQQRTGSLGTGGGGGNSGGTMTVGAADDRHEQEAEQTAHRVVAALQARGPALSAPATSPGAALSRAHDPAVALAPAPLGIARAAAPPAAPPAASALFGPTPPGARCLPPRRPPFAFVLTTGGANLHPTEPQAQRDLAASLGLLPVTTKVEVLLADPARDWARVCVLAGPGPAAGLVGRVGWVRYSWLDARWPDGDPAATMYVIQPGDTALGLAARFYGVANNDHPETNADLRRYVEVLARVNQHGSYWIERGNDGDPLNWMRARVRATYAMWVPSRAWAAKAAGAVPNPSLTGGAWATVHQQLQQQGWGGVNILQAVSLFAQDVAVVGDRAVGALRHAVVVGGTLVGEVTAETAHAVLPVLQDLAAAAFAPAVLMAKLGALAAKRLADVPAALLALLERKAQELLTALLGPHLVQQLGGAMQAILRDPKAFIVNLGNALSKGVGGLLAHLSDPKNFIDDVLQWVATQLGIASLPPLPWTWTTLIPVAQEVLHLTEDNLTRLLAAALRRHGDRNPEGTIARARAAAGGLQTLLTEGIGGVWAQALAARQTAAGLAQQVFDGVKQWVLGQLVQGAVSALVKLGVPGAGPFLEAAQGIYAAFQTFLSYKDTLAGLMGQLLPTLGGLAAGTAGAVAATGAAITKVLVGLIPPALDFLARFLGLGELANRIKTFLHGIQTKIDGLIAKLVERLAGAVKGLAAGHGRGSSPAPGHTPVSGHGTDPAHDARVAAGVQELKELDKAYEAGGITHQQAQAIASRVKAAHPVFTSITVVDGGDTWDYEYVASTGHVKGDKQRELEEDLAKAHAAFGTTLFSRHDLGLCLRLSESTATRRINQWKGRAEGESGGGEWQALYPGLVSLRCGHPVFL